MVRQQVRSVAAAWLVSTAFASAQKLSFISPKLNAVTGTPTYSVGDFVVIEWTTQFTETSLLLYQYLQNGTFLASVLANAYNTSQTSYVWEVAAIDEAEMKGSPFHFMLDNANNANCKGCALNSPTFNLKAKGARLPSSTLSTHTSTSTGSGGAPATNSAATHSPTASTASPVAAGQTGTQSPNSQPTQDHKSNDLGVPLGVGLGVGIPVLIALVALLVFCLRKRRKDQQSEKSDPERSRDPDPSPNQMREHRESGALGPWQHPARQPGGGPRPILPYRLSYNSSLWSHHSWIDPFEFERPELRDQDAMSQLRASIDGSAPGSVRGMPRSLHSSGRSEWSFAMENIPEAPQPVHHNYPDNWPLS